MKHRSTMPPASSGNLPPPPGAGSEKGGERVSNLTYWELVSFFHQQMGRVEMIWFRVMYLHAAIVGVLIFFSQAELAFPVARVIVFGFYTVNMVIFHFALQEGYAGLHAVHSDLARFTPSDGAVENWFRTRDYGARRSVRLAIMICSWLLVALLLSRNWSLPLMTG